MASRTGVLLATPNYLPTIGGAELAVHQLALALSRAGHRPVVLCPDLGPLPSGIPFHVWRYAAPRRGGWRAHLGLLLAAIPYASRRFDVDLIHAHYADTMGWAAIASRALHHRPVIVTSHGADLQKVPSIGYGLRLDGRADARVRTVMKRADALVAISTEIAEEMAEAGAEMGRVIRVPNGVDLTWMARWREAAVWGGTSARVLEMAGRPKHSSLGGSGARIGDGNARECGIVAVGRNHAKKGFELLLRAMSKVVAEEPGTRLSVAGEGTELLETLARELGLVDEVEFLGRIPPKGTPVSAEHPMPVELAKLLGGADLFVSPSLVEGFPLVNVEAMAAGLPLVLTDISGNREVVGSGDGENGLLVPAGDAGALAEAIVALIRDPERRGRMGLCSASMAKAYDWGEIARRHVEVYRGVLR